MKIFVTHPTGNRNVRAVIASFAGAGILAKFGTTLAVNPKSYLLGMLPQKLKQELLRRSYPLDFKLIYARPLLEVLRNILPKLGLRGAVRHEVGFASVDKVYGDMDRGIAAYLPELNSKQPVNAVYAYEDGALDTFKAAKAIGTTCLYDLPIGYWRSARLLLKTEQERWPEWAMTLTGFLDSEEKLERKDEELRLADHIYVASSFTAKTLNDFPGKLAPVTVIPYGFPPVVNQRIYVNPLDRPLKLLFVGGLSQRKGIADLFAAVKNIGNRVELTVVGRKTNAHCPALDSALADHKWIPSLPYEKVLELMREQDVLVFPSLFEGFGLVITEAMSQGTPVITTDRTAGPDLIVHNENGWIVEAGSTAALQLQIEKILDHPEKVAIAGLAAMETAKIRPMIKYGDELSESLIKILNEQN